MQRARGSYLTPTTCRPPPPESDDPTSASLRHGHLDRRLCPFLLSFSFLLFFAGDRPFHFVFFSHPPNCLLALFPIGFRIASSCCRSLPFYCSLFYVVFRCCFILPIPSPSSSFPAAPTARTLSAYFCSRKSLKLPTTGFLVCGLTTTTPRSCSRLHCFLLSFRSAPPPRHFLPYRFWLFSPNRLSPTPSSLSRHKNGTLPALRRSYLIARKTRPDMQCRPSPFRNNDAVRASYTA